MAAIAYIYLEKTKFNLIAKTIDFKMIIGINKVKTEVLGSKSLIKPAQSFLEYL